MAELSGGSSCISLSTRSIEFVAAAATDEGPSLKTASAAEKTPSVELPPSAPPNQILCDAADVPLPYWRKCRGVGLGLLNPHTLCFVNSVVQALAYTPGFADDCLEERHRLSCCSRLRAAARRKEAAAAAAAASTTAAAAAGGRRVNLPEVSSTFCVFCKLEQQVLSIHRADGGPQRSAAKCPSGGPPRGWVHNNFASYIKPFIWKAFRPGRQEDAHEFFRYLIDALMKAPATPAAAALQQQQQQQQEGRKEVKPEVALTSYFGRLFGCWLRSSVVCSQCSRASVRFEGAVDISIDIGGGPSPPPGRSGASAAAQQNVYSIEKALSRFVAKETLSGSNAYMCSHCQQKVKATKQLELFTLPRVLTLSLKRFSLTVCGGCALPIKNHRPVSFPALLNLLPFLPQDALQLQQRLLQQQIEHQLQELEHNQMLVQQQQPQQQQKSLKKQQPAMDKKASPAASTTASSPCSSPAHSPSPSLPSRRLATAATAAAVAAAAGAATSEGVTGSSTASDSHPSSSRSATSAPAEAAATATAASVVSPSYMYRLFAVITHSGGSLSSGHYRVFVRAPTVGTTARAAGGAEGGGGRGDWIAIDDELVSLVSETAVLHRLQQEAYLLFYSKVPSQAEQQLQQLLQQNKTLKQQLHQQTRQLPIPAVQDSDDESSLSPPEDTAELSTSEDEWSDDSSSSSTSTRNSTSSSNNNMHAVLPKLRHLDRLRRTMQITSSRRRRVLLALRCRFLIFSIQRARKGKRSIRANTNLKQQQQQQKQEQQQRQQQRLQQTQQLLQQEPKQRRSIGVVTEAMMKKRKEEASSRKTQFGCSAAPTWDEEEGNDVPSGAEAAAAAAAEQQMFERLQKQQQPLPQKRSRHDREYDLGRVTKVKNPLSHKPVGESTVVKTQKDGAGGSFLVHQRAAFDMLQQQKQNGSSRSSQGYTNKKGNDRKTPQKNKRMQKTGWRRNGHH
ncbi:ubiquitin carboxyl-terminal hydrolase, putative [Eimeria maxima]|uniref:ubiquitinyl hydrolase 1 n=1 Tax=Eimeria maxima TaxID=5804 RepID=U6M0S7_EIMMA|nr:ubiquitin carboxyl-terminal hydrolase, putative [Eimeria maxima]CDJ56693.1 ubiquitin carboxyl-terminal hydrolase, putative [Eimeria maxima]